MRRRPTITELELAYAEAKARALDDLRLRFHAQWAGSNAFRDEVLMDFGPLPLVALAALWAEDNFDEASLRGLDDEPF